MTERKSPKLRPNKVHTVFLEGVTPSEPVVGRHYTLTHSDRTRDLYLTVGPEYHEAQISGTYTRFMRDQVLAQWSAGTQGEALPGATGLPITPYELHVYVHVSGGRVLGRARNRNRTFIRELPRALQSIRYADAYLVVDHETLDDSPVFVHFESHLEKYGRVEPWGYFRDYVVPHPQHVERRR